MLALGAGLQPPLHLKKRCCCCCCCYFKSKTVLLLISQAGLSRRPTSDQAKRQAEPLVQLRVALGAFEWREHCAGLAGTR